MVLDIKYKIQVKVLDKVFNNKMTFIKNFSYNLEATEIALFDNTHIIDKRYILDYFTEEINQYTESHKVEDSITGTTELEVVEFEIFTITKNVEVYFENEEEQGKYTLYPTTKVYVEPNTKPLNVPVLKGELINPSTIKWSWKEDTYAHYLLNELKEPIAQIPVGINHYIESGLQKETRYARYLKSFNENNGSPISNVVSILTPSESIEETSLTNFKEKRITKYLEDIVEVEQNKVVAFKNGIGFGNDCKLINAEHSDIDIITPIEFTVKGFGTKDIPYYPQVSQAYRYKVDAKYKKITRDGSVTINSRAYPNEFLKVRLYRYGVVPLTIKWKVTGKVTYLIKNSNSSFSSYTKLLSIEGTYLLVENLNNVKYDSQGYATMKPKNEALNLGTVGDMLKKEANKISGFSNAVEGQTHYHEIRIYDNYGTDCDETYRETSNYGISSDGSFRICNGEESKPTMGSNLYARGHADGQLYTYEVIKEGTFNEADGGLNIFTQAELNAPLRCVANSSLTYTGPNQTKKIEPLATSGDIATDNNGNVIIGGALVSGAKTFSFNETNPGIAIVYKNIFTGYSKEKTYKFVTEIVAISGDIYIDNKNKVVVGQTYTEVGNIHDTICFESKPRKVVLSYSEIFPPVGTEPMHVIVNGKTDTNNPEYNGKDDYIEVAHKFALDHKFYDCVYSLILEGSSIPSGSSIQYKYSTSSSSTSKVNADILTFSSNYLRKKTIPIEGIIANKVFKYHLTNEKDFEVNEKIEVDPNPYNRYELDVKSHNSECLIKRFNKNVTVSSLICNVNAIIKAVKHPSTEWNPNIHNGYYYFNNHEHFLYVGGKPTIIKLNGEIIEQKPNDVTLVKFKIKLKLSDGRLIDNLYEKFVKNDGNEYKLYDNLLTLITPWLTSIGLTEEDILDYGIEALNKKDLVYLSKTTSSSESSEDMGEVFKTWKRFWKGGYPESGPNEINAWEWDNLNKTIVCTKNTNNFIGFVSNEKIREYTCNLNISSTDRDDDAICFIIGYKKIGDKEYTLVLARSCKGLSVYDFEIRLNYNDNDEKYITSIEVDKKMFPYRWSEYPKGVNLKIIKTSNGVKCYSSKIGEEKIEENKVLEIDFNSDPRFTIFKDATNYGYGCISQKGSTFKNIIFKGESITSSILCKTIRDDSSEIIIESTDFYAKPLPQQFSPISLRSSNNGLLHHIENIKGNKGSLDIIERFKVNDESTVIMLTYTNIDVDNTVVKVDGNTYFYYEIKNNALILDRPQPINAIIEVTYRVKNSFTLEYFIGEDKIKVKTNTDKPLGVIDLMYETSKDTNSLKLDYLSLNPIHNIEYGGFLYIDDEELEPYYIGVHINPKVMFINTNDKSRFYIGVLDINKNPVEGEIVSVEVTNGKVVLDTSVTDRNGIVSGTFIPNNVIGIATIEGECMGLKSKVEIKLKERYVE